MYRNKLEKFFIFSLAKSLLIPNTVGTCHRFAYVHKKYNYRDYIKKMSMLSSPLKKVLPELLPLRGPCERENVLDMQIFNLVYFFSLAKTQQGTTAPRLELKSKPVSNLVYFGF